MKIAQFTIEGVSQYQQGRYHETPKKEKESADDWEKRTWRDRAHATETGDVYIPATALKNCIAEAAKFLNLQVPGKGKATYTKHFDAGILITEDIPIGVKKEDMVGVAVFGNAQGKKGQPGGRVKKTFPTATKWGGVATCYILDETITNSVFEQVLKGAGQFIGLGVFRPRNGGTNGRFAISNMSFKEE